MNQQKPDNGFYGEINTVQINNEMYHVEPVEFEDETFFFVRSSNEIICMIMQNEKDEWEADCAISRELFGQIMKCINKLYFE